MTTPFKMQGMKLYISYHIVALEEHSYGAGAYMGTCYRLIVYKQYILRTDR